MLNTILKHLTPNQLVELYYRLLALERAWELLLFPAVWSLRVNHPYGKSTTFMRETWVGPFCLRVWTNPKSVTHPPLSLARELKLGRRRENVQARQPASHLRALQVPGALPHRARD
jgi:hypothetical protein